MIYLTSLLTLILLGSHLCTSARAESMLALTKAGKPVCTVVLTDRAEPELLMTRAVQSIINIVQHWGGASLPVVTLKASAQNLPEGPAIVLTTLERLRKVAPEIETSTNAVMRVASLDEDGFACVPVESGGVLRIFVVSRTPRGVFNGAVYLRDFLIDGNKDNLYIQAENVVRTPQMKGRPVYLLTIWGNEDEYTARDWMTVFDSFARDGMDRVYFWLSGHFPSKRFPQTYKVDDVIKGVTYDSTKGSGIGTVEAQRRMIQYAHQMGLKFYLGGALGGWVGSMFLTHLDRDTLRTNSIGDTGSDDSEAALCPSNSRVRQALIQYYKEMFDVLPEADGLYIESADEMGECQCNLCRKPVDELGSKQFGQAQLSLVQEIMHGIWQDHPDARLAYTIGYRPHQKDSAYYEVIRQMNDERLEWMEARGSWEFPDPQGKPFPAAYFARKIMGWKYHDTKPLEQIVSDVHRMGREGWYGCISTFSPGFASGSFYRDIPFPTDQLPYLLTHLVHREMTWEPALTIEGIHKRVQRRFFGKEASEDLGKYLWELRELIRTASSKTWAITASREWGYLGCGQVSPEVLTQMDKIEQRVQQARSGASPKTLAGLDLMTRAINDIRRECREKKPG